MKPPAPKIVRKGAVVRIAGAGDDTASAACAYAISFVDLQFNDGHIERWLGSGSLRDDPEHPVHYAELVDWGAAVAVEHSMIADLGMNFSSVDRRALDDAPVEVVFEWHASLPRLD
jgi:hypothetical protein